MKTTDQAGNWRTAAMLLALAVAYGCGKKPDITGKWEGPLDVGSIVHVLGKPGDTTFHLVLNIHTKRATGSGPLW